METTDLKKQKLFYIFQTSLDGHWIIISITDVHEQFQNIFIWQPWEVKLVDFKGYDEKLS